jgi:hypothetical protein
VWLETADAKAIHRAILVAGWRRTLFSRNTSDEQCSGLPAGLGIRRTVPPTRRKWPNGQTLPVAALVHLRQITLGRHSGEASAFSSLPRPLVVQLAAAAYSHGSWCPRGGR